jgi:NADH-quinone oxidoreductase subunit J
MMLNLGTDTAMQEKQWLQPKVWIGPSLLTLVLLVEMIILLTRGDNSSLQISVVDPRKVALSLYREYIIALELAGFLLMAGIVGAAHIGQHKKRTLHRFLEEKEEPGVINEESVEKKELEVGG